MRAWLPHLIVRLAITALAVAAGCGDTETDRAADAGMPDGAAPETDARVRVPDALPDAVQPPDATTQTPDAPFITVSLSDMIVATHAETPLYANVQDPRYRPLSYTWSLRSAPDGSLAVLGAIHEAQAAFTPDRDGIYLVALTVSAETDSTTATMLLTAENAPPQFQSSATLSVYTGTPIDVTATAVDPNGDAVTYRWSLRGHPEGSKAMIAASASSTGHLVTDVDGPYVLEVIASDGHADSDPLDITVSSVHPLHPLAHRIIDAEQSKSLGRIVMVADEPSALYIFDPSTLAEVTVPLAQTPTSVSVSPDGHSAVVGHDGNLSYVDLINANVVRVYPMTIPVSDVVLAGNGFVYAFPASVQPDALHTVNLETGYESESGAVGVDSSTLGKLHPDGNRIYAASSSGYSANLLDVLLDAPASPTGRAYDGGGPTCGDVWFTEDGLRIISRCGAIFSAENDATTDMTFLGTVAGLAGHQILEASDSKAAGKLLLIRASAPYSTDASPDEEVWVYGDQDLQLEKRQSLGGFIVNGTSFSAHGRFVFPDDDGAHYHVFVEADPTSALSDDYAIQTYAF